MPNSGAWVLRNLMIKGVWQKGLKVRGEQGDQMFLLKNCPKTMKNCP